MRIPSAAGYGILLGVLFLLYRFTAIGLDRRPDLIACIPADCSQTHAVTLAPARRSDRHLLVPVELRGQRLYFLLDTGASSTVVAMSAARGIGALGATRPILGAINDEFGWLRILRVEDLVVAGHGYGRFDVAAIDMTAIRAALGPEVAGVLGADVLGLQPSQIDFARSTLRLGVTEADFERTRPPGTADTDEEIWQVGGGWFVRTRVDEREAYFLIDSGSNVSQLAEELADRIGDIVPSAGVSVDATGLAVEPVYTVQLPLLAVGDLGRRDFEVMVGESNLLGADFFAGTVLRLDAGRGRVTLRARSAGPPGHLGRGAGRDDP